MSGVRETIRQAEALLPGEPVPKGESDPRWQAIILVEEYVLTEPDAVWEFVQAWGGHPQEDLRTAIAVLLLEDLMECHFQLVFPRVEERVLGDPLFADTFLRAWKLGQAEESANSARYDELVELARERVRSGSS